MTRTPSLIASRVEYIIYPSRVERPSPLGLLFQLLHFSDGVDGEAPADGFVSRFAHVVTAPMADVNVGELVVVRAADTDGAATTVRARGAATFAMVQRRWVPKSVRMSGGPRYEHLVLVVRVRLARRSFESEKLQAVRSRRSGKK